MTTATYNRYRRKGQIQHFQNLSLNHFLTLTAFDRAIMDFNTNSPFLIVTCAPLDLTLDTILLATRLAALEDSHSLLCGTMSLDASISGFRRRRTPPRLDRATGNIPPTLFTWWTPNHPSKSPLASQRDNITWLPPKWIRTPFSCSAKVLSYRYDGLHNCQFTKHSPPISCESSRGKTASYLSPYSQFWHTLHVYWMTNK